MNYLRLADEYIEHQDCTIDSCAFIQAYHATSFSDAVKLASAIRELHEKNERLDEKYKSVSHAWTSQNDEKNELTVGVARLQEELEAYKGAIDYVRGCYPEDVFLPDSDSLDASSARWARMVCDNIKAEAERRTALSPTPEAREEKEMYEQKQRLTLGVVDKCRGALMAFRHGYASHMIYPRKGRLHAVRVGLYCARTYLHNTSKTWPKCTCEMHRRDAHRYNPLDQEKS